MRAAAWRDRHPHRSRVVRLLPAALLLALAPLPLARIYLDDEMRSAAHAAIESGRYILADECAAFEE